METITESCSVFKTITSSKENENPKANVKWRRVQHRHSLVYTLKFCRKQFSSQSNGAAVVLTRKMITQTCKWLKIIKPPSPKKLGIDIK